MATLTIRNLDDALKSRLRLRAAARNRSMEDEVRHILRAVLLEPTGAELGLSERIRARFAGLGDVQLPVMVREPIRLPPEALQSAGGAPAKRRQAAAKPRRAR